MFIPGDFNFPNPQPIPDISVSKEGVQALLDLEVAKDGNGLTREEMFLLLDDPHTDTLPLGQEIREAIFFFLGEEERNNFSLADGISVEEREWFVNPEGVGFDVFNFDNNDSSLSYTDLTILDRLVGMRENPPLPIPFPNP